MRRQLLLMLMINGVCLAGCGGPRSGPEPLPVDRVSCSKCGMLISSVSNAGEALVPGEETGFYDDIGCMAASATSMKRDARLFVQLADGAGWASVESAWFAVAPRTRSPMGYGFMAFAAEDEARRADTDGTARTWESIVRRMGDH